MCRGLRAWMELYGAGPAGDRVSDCASSGTYEIRCLIQNRSQDDQTHRDYVSCPRTPPRYRARQFRHSCSSHIPTQSLTSRRRKHCRRFGLTKERRVCTARQPPKLQVIPMVSHALNTVSVDLASPVSQVMGRATASMPSPIVC